MPLFLVRWTDKMSLADETAWEASLYSYDDFD